MTMEKSSSPWIKIVTYYFIFYLKLLITTARLHFWRNKIIEKLPKLPLDGVLKKLIFGKVVNTDR
jgi:hypothetical protein